MDNKPLSKRQADVLKFMHRHHNVWSMWPTVREIGDELGISSPQGVMCHLRAMKKKGYVTNLANVARSWRPVKRAVDTTCPDCGCEIEVVEEIA